jgi:hypothetical protein
VINYHVLLRTVHYSKLCCSTFNPSIELAQHLLLLYIMSMATADTVV